MTELEEQLRDTLEFTFELIDTLTTTFEQGKVPETRFPSHYRSLAGKHRGIGVIYALLDRPETARENFVESASYFVKCIQLDRSQRATEEPDFEDEPTTLLQLLHVAVLSQDEDVIQEAVATAQGLDASYLDIHADTAYQYHRAIGYATLIDGGDASESITGIKQEIQRMPDHLVTYYEIILTLFKGLNDRNLELTKRGLDMILEHHDSDVDDSTSSPSELFGVPATAFATIAQRRGIDIWPDSRYIPDNLRPE